MGACRVGCRKALGYDAKRRRYWAFGAGLGAWRVFVEEQEGALWGWYEGAHSSAKAPTDAPSDIALPG